jgi:hypothetical protein
LLLVDLPREQRRRPLSIRHASGDGALCRFTTRVKTLRSCRSATRAETSPFVDPPRERGRCFVSIHHASEDLRPWVTS